MDSPALTSRTFVRSITTAWSTLLPVTVAATSFTVSKSTKGAVLLGEVVTALDCEFLTMLLITFLLIRAGSLLTMTLPAEAEADADAPPEADEDEEAPLD